MHFIYSYTVLLIKKFVLKNCEFDFSSKIEGRCSFSGRFAIGKRCRFIGSSIAGRVYISDYVSVADNTLIKSVFDTYVSIGYGTIIGPNSLISTDYHYRCDGVVNDAILRRNSDHFSRKKEICKNIQIGQHVWIGCNVYIRPGVTIGDYATIGANSVVTRNVKEGEIFKNA